MTTSLMDRMIGAAKLQSTTYEEVEADRSATLQALAVVVLAATAAGFGLAGYGGLRFVLLGVISAVLGWAIWAALIWVIGTKLLAEPTTRSDWGEIARTTGFAQAPGLLRLFGFVPVLGPIVALVSSVWMLAATVVAVRQALDYRSTWRAVGVVTVGWIVNLLIFGALTSPSAA